MTQKKEKDEPTPKTKTSKDEAESAHYCQIWDNTRLPNQAIRAPSEGTRRAAQDERQAHEGDGSFR